MVTFPSSLAPSFFEVEELPSYGLKIVENEIGREVRRFTETTGHNTRLSLRYSGMTSIEVSQLIGFYQSVKGTFEAFTLPLSFYLNPDDYNIALALLEDTTNWRFESPPRIDTIVSDLYTTEFTLISLKEEENLNLDTFFGITQGVKLVLDTRKLVYEGKDNQDAQYINLYLDTSTLETIEIEEIGLLSLAFNLGQVAVTSSRSIKNLILLNSFNDFLGIEAAPTEIIEFSLNLPSVLVLELDITSLIPSIFGYNLGLSTAINVINISPALFRFIPNNNLPDDSNQGTFTSAVRGYWAEDELTKEISFGLIENTKNVAVIPLVSNILLTDINLGVVQYTNNVQKYKGVTELV